MLKWETHTVERLFHKIRDTMPSVGNTDVTDQEKLDSVAFILQQNGFPAGSTELTDTPGASHRCGFCRKVAPAPPRAGALVQAIGCLQEISAEQVGADQQHRPESDNARSDERRRQTIRCRVTARNADD